MNKRLSLLFVAQALYLSLSAQLQVKQLLTEGLKDPQCIDNAHPRFSWILNTEQPNTLQSAYEITVMDGRKTTWTSGKMATAESLHAPYEGDALTPGKLYSWKVKVWDNHGHSTTATEPAYFRMGITDWKAKWIEPGYQEPATNRPCPIFKTSFHNGKKIASAIAYITSHGLYEARINDKKVGDGFLTPGFTSYNKRLQYQAYDVTNLLQPGDNNIEITVGSGWYRGTIGWGENKYGKTLGVLYQMEVTYTDGTKETIITDEHWKSGTGKITYSEIYNGEWQDNRKETTWTGVKVINIPLNNLVASVSPPVTKHEVFSNIKMIKTPAGENVIDFGQNLSGFIHFKATGNAGDSIILEHGEILDKKGNFYNANLRTAAAKDIFVLSGKGEEFFEPHFTFHGFRYVRVKTKAKMTGIEAVAIYSNTPATGNFECSNPMINQLQHNIQWSQVDNFVDIPTDCPQRDERLGWTGDAQAFVQTATFNHNVNTFFTKWLRDLAADQVPNGAVPHVIPNVLGNDASGSAGWGDVATVVPWTMYQVYSDKRLLENQYPSMKAWVDYIQLQSPNNMWASGAHFGDWLSYKSENRSADTYTYITTQCYYALSTQLVINAAKVLGKQDDVAKYTALLKKIKDAFCAEYVTPNGRIMSNTQTSYVLALAFDMLPENIRPMAAKYLVDDIASYNNHLTTGFLGTYLLSNTLTRFGYTDVAYKLLLQETYPSWLYPVKMGATTIWERWDGMKTDSTFQTTDMNSFNHYAYGAIGDWMYKNIAGINMDSSTTGFKKIKIMPRPGGNLTYAKAGYESGYGRIGVDWKIQDTRFIMDVEIPVNTTAEIYVPGKEGKEEVGSGKYHYESTLNKAVQ
ncbi:glycoside hydrolase family 78 protein [Chitinophaga sp.]|uniref:glycoside hydrolase family 78 protein n=1 Tax=Chitinophaga sp. TaxID=1869181 RepID=UPI0031D286B8